jgi:hypothetical protein
MRLFSAALLVLVASTTVQAQAPEAVPLFSIRSDETLPLKPVTWINTATCAPMLVSIEGVDVMEGPPGITLQIRPQKVPLSSASCAPGAEQDGGMVMVTAGKVTSRTEGLLTYRIRMTSPSGPVQTTYRARVILFPAPTTSE